MMTLFNSLQYIAPQRFLTRMCGIFANCQVPFIKRRFIRLYSNIFHINLADTVHSDLERYVSLNDFFTRHLKPEARPIDQDSHSIISPVDGTLYQFGKIDQAEKFNVKGFDFTLTELLGGNKEYAALFKEGDFCCLYLSPQDYHRVHMPMTGVLQEMTYVPGKLFSVAPKILESVPKIFSRNERLISLFETPVGPMIVILVGAIIVGSIHTAWSGAVNSDHSKEITCQDYRDENITLKKGDELGYFEIGSTVITLFPKRSVKWLDSMKTNTHRMVGECLGITAE